MFNQTFKVALPYRNKVIYAAAAWAKDNKIIHQRMGNVFYFEDEETAIMFTLLFG